ncbi:MAG: glycosyltransferase family 4 protein [Prevotella sp.]
MRVLIVNTSEKTGGAAVAANRLLDALNNNGVKAKMLVRDKVTDDITVVGLPQTLLRQWSFLWERLVVFFHTHFSKHHLFEIDIANAGCDITRLREFREADVIHLHWINQGMLSLRGIRKILDSNKAVVWTMHDIWPASSICHYSRGCNYFKSHCHNCQLLPGGGYDDDLASKVWKAKKRMLADRNVMFVACSKWLEGEAKRSSLLVGQSITNIPNTIDTRVFCVADKRQSRMAAGLPLDKRVILFVSQKVTDKRKGMSFFVDALERMVARRPEMKDDTVVAVLGGHAEDVVEQLALPAFPLGYVSDERRIVAVYNSADAFVLPSLEDNLPNTIMEAMACGVPCVGFKVGGIPEMIDHERNGYVAAVRDVDDLAEGMEWVLDPSRHGDLSSEAVRKVSMRYSQHSVAMKYIEVYNQAIAYKRYKI